MRKKSAQRQLFVRRAAGAVTTASPSEACVKSSAAMGAFLAGAMRAVVSADWGLALEALVRTVVGDPGIDRGIAAGPVP